MRYNPKDREPLLIENHQKKKLAEAGTLNLLLWNISYGGMPDKMDFFFSGGTQTQLKESLYRQNFSEILHQIDLAKDSIDVFLFHKIDSSSKRSYLENQHQKLKESLADFESVFCLNYAVPFIPVPLNKPIGELHSGMLSMSKLASNKSTRIALENKKYYWPKNLFTAQKCMSVHSFPFGGKQLFVINVHLNSYDFKGEIRLSQLESISKFADSLYQEGHFIIIGGGWNMNPPGFKKHQISYGYKGHPIYPEIDQSAFFKDWLIAYDPEIPTSRSLHDAYRHGAINTSIKDFFICSPNVSLLEVKAIDQQFRWSDHHPVYLKVFLWSGEGL